MNGLLDRVTFSRPHRFTCGMGKSYVVVRTDGKIVSCQMTLEKPIGSIDDPDVITSMQNGSFVQPQSLTVDGKTPCKTCQWRYICCGGCPLLTNSPYCNVYKALIPEVLRVEAKRLIRYGYKQDDTDLPELPSALPM